ncbi:hypothetical protein [Nocardia sp. NPDC004722]
MGGDTVRLDGNTLVLPGGVRVRFIRTLRLPEQGTHRLPPGLGDFPLRRVADYADRVPEEMARRGGVMLPIYLREALWLKFATKEPAALQIGAGRVCAVSGKPWSDRLSHDPQNYVVLPRQPWLDGINSGIGTIRQFVAVPLGSGATVEGQITGEETWGGIQLQNFELNPAELTRWRAAEDARRAAAEERRRQAIERRKQAAEQRRLQAEKLGDNPFARPSGSGERGSPSLPALPPWLSEADVAPTPTPNGTAGSGTNEGPLFPPVPGPAERLAGDPGSSGRLFARRARAGRAMGLGVGGTMRQEIFEDQRGPGDWAAEWSGRVFVHLVTPPDWLRITGEAAPPSPADRAAYTRAGLPWFDYFDSEATDLAPADALSGVAPVGDWLGDDHEPWQDPAPGQVHRLGVQKGVPVQDGQW